MWNIPTAAKPLTPKLRFHFHLAYHFYTTTGNTYKMYTTNGNNLSVYYVYDSAIGQIQRKDNPDRIAAASSTQEQIQWNPAGNGHRRPWKKTLGKLINRTALWRTRRMMRLPWVWTFANIYIIDDNVNIADSSASMIASISCLHCQHSIPTTIQTSKKDKTGDEQWYGSLIIIHKNVHTCIQKLIYQAHVLHTRMYVNRLRLTSMKR